MRSRRALVLSIAAVALAALAVRLLQRGAATSSAAVGGPAAERAAGAAPADALLDPSDPAAPARLTAPIAPSSAPSSGAYTGWSDLRQPGRIAGIVQTLDGLPIEGALCALRPGASTFGSAAPLAAGDEAERETRTDAQGRFALSMANGWWGLDVRAEGYGLRREDHLCAGDFRIVELFPAVKLTVNARTSDAGPLAGVACSLLDDFHRIDGRPLARAATDSAGRAVLDGVAPGESYLLLEKDGYQQHFETVNVPRGTGWHEVEVELQPGVGLCGRVVAEENGAPLAGARVRVEAFATGQSLIAELTTGADGSFATELHFAPDEPVSVIASAPRRAEATRLLLVRPDAGDARARSIELRLGRNERRLRGRALDERGPLAGVALAFTPSAPLGRGRDALAASLAQVTSHHERWRPAGVTDERGVFEIAGLAAAPEYVLLLRAQGYAPAVRWVASSGSDGVTEVGDVFLEPSGSLFGFALAEEDGGPLVNARVRAQLEIVVSEADFGSGSDAWRPTAWWRPLEAKTAGDGSFRIDEVASGVYDLRLGDLEVGQVRVAPGVQAGPLYLRAPRAPFEEEEPDTLRGIVLGAGDGPMGEAFVALFDAEASAEGSAQDPAQDSNRAPVAMTMTDFRGIFEIGAPRGRALRLHVTALLGGFEDYDRALENREGPLEIRLARLAQPSEPLVGLVLDPLGAPLAGIPVAIEPPENRYCGCLSFETRSGPDGLVTFHQLADKDYRIVARDPEQRWAEVEVFPARPGGYFEVVFE